MCAALAIERAIPGRRTDVRVQVIVAMAGAAAKDVCLKENSRPTIGKEPGARTLDLRDGCDQRRLDAQLARGLGNVRIR